MYNLNDQYLAAIIVISTYCFEVLRINWCDKRLYKPKRVRFPAVSAVSRHHRQGRVWISNFFRSNMLAVICMHKSYYILYSRKRPTNGQVTSTII